MSISVSLLDCDCFCLLLFGDLLYLMGWLRLLSVVLPVLVMCLLICSLKARVFFSSPEFQEMGAAT